MTDETKKTTAQEKRALSRRDFLKIGATASMAGAAAPLMAGRSRVFHPIQQISGDPLTIKMMSWFWQEPGRNDAWRAMLADFHAAQNDIRIEEAGWAFDDYTNNILVQVRSGMIDADLFTNTPDLAVRMLAAGQMAPVEDVVENAGIENLSAAHNFLRKDDHLYGLDCVTVKFGLLYNSGMFEEAGVEPPTTIDEWVEGATALTQRPDQFGIYSPHVPSAPEATWFTLQEWVMPYDGVWAEGQTPLVTSEPVINGIKLFKTMYDNAMPQGTDEATANRMYGLGQIAQMLIVSAAVNVWKANGPDVYPLLRSVAPPWESRKTLTRIHPLAVNANAPETNQQASKEFMTWLFRKENYQNLLERALDVVPAYPDGIRQEYLDELPWIDGYNAGVDVTPPDVMGEFILYNSEFGRIVVDHLQTVLSGGRPVEDAMADAQVELEALAERVFD